MQVRMLPYALALTFVLVACSVPLFVHAEDALRATIRAELKSDPRTDTLTDAQLNAMVELLASSAESQHISADDILYRPTRYEDFARAASAAPEADPCADTPALLCSFSRAFGFVGPAYAIPFSLGAASMGLVWILAEMLHRKRHPQVYASPRPPSAA